MPRPSTYAVFCLKKKKIAGSAGGIRLAVPKRGVRPTMDGVKAAVFSRLVEFVAGARVLDLFTGIGALEIEALIRGASSGVFVEEDRQSAEIIDFFLNSTTSTEIFPLSLHDALPIYKRDDEGHKK